MYSSLHTVMCSSTNYYDTAEFLIFLCGVKMFNNDAGCLWVYTPTIGYSSVVNSYYTYIIQCVYSLADGKLIYLFDYSSVYARVE